MGWKLSSAGFDLQGSIVMTDHVGPDEASEPGGLLYAANEVLGLNLATNSEVSWAMITRLGLPDSCSSLSAICITQYL